MDLLTGGGGLRLLLFFLLSNNISFGRIVGLAEKRDCIQVSSYKNRADSIARYLCWFGL